MELYGRAGASSESLGKESKCSYFGVVRSEATMAGVSAKAFSSTLRLCGSGLREDGGPCRDMPCPLKPKLLQGTGDGSRTVVSVNCVAYCM